MITYHSFSIVSSIAITCLLAALTAWFTVRLLRRRLGRRKGLPPPGPRPWPVIGNLNLMQPLLHRSLHELSATYGPLMQLKLGSVTVVTTNSPDMARQFLKTHDSTFASRPRLAAGKHTTYNYSNITWSACGPHWRQGRKIMLTHLFSPKSLEAYERVRVEERRDFLARLHGSRGEHVRFKDHLSRVNLSVMSRIVLGRNYFTGSNNHRNDRSSGESGVLSLEEIQKMLDEFFSINAAFVIGDWIPWLARLDLKGYVKRMKILAQKFDEFLEFCIDEHMMARNGRPKGPAKDMMDVLLDLADDPDLEVKLTIDNVKAFTLDLLAGGTDTAATTVEWAMAELMKNPEKINTAAEELDRVIGRGRWVEEKDTANLPYLDAILKETLRLHPAGSLLIPHAALKDCQVEHHHISKGTLVLINLWSMGRNPAVWDSPEEFRPERFLNKDIDIKGQSFQLLPFGSGRRMCPGYPLGLKMMQSSLANLLHGFEWRLPREMKPRDLDMEETFGLTSPRKYPLVAVFEPRLAPHLYSSTWAP